ncbi:MAG: ATP synthase F1 subunit delta [Acidobacteria bacterium]|nr:ATP synthase F1 subunit delta [Acidobacteriota bacterium]
MSARSAVRRYAAVLFEVVHKTGDVSRAERDLRAFLDVVTGHPQLQAVLTSPAVSAAKKRLVLEQVLDASGEFTDAVRRLVLMLADRDRLGSLVVVADAFTERVMVHQKIIDATVETATPMPEAQRTALTAALSAASGAEVRLHDTVNPDIVGGIIARVGSVVYDASLTHQLEKMRQRLLAQA